MASINLDIGSHFDSRGLDQMDRGVKRAAGNVRRASGAIGDVIGKLGECDGALGKVAKTGGQLLGNIMSMGIWGAVAAAVGVCVNKFAELREQLAANKKASDELAEGWAKAREFQERRDAKRAQKAAEEAKKIADAEAKEHARVVKMQDEARQKNAKRQNAAADRAGQMAVKELEIDGASDFAVAYERATNEIDKARRQVEFVRRFGGDLAEAEDALALAEMDFSKLLADSVRAREKEAADRRAKEEEIEAAEEAAAEAQRAAAEVAARRAEIEKRATDRAAAGEKEIAEADKQLADARRRAAELEENAARARGKSFNEWQRGERKLAKDADRQAKRDAGNIERARRDQDALRSRLFDRDGKLRKSANKADLKRFGELETFLQNQDPANNPALKVVKDLEEKRQKIAEDTKAAIEAIKAELKNITT